MQSALRGDESARGARRRLCRVLSARRHGEPAQGITPRTGTGSDELLALLGESIPRAADSRGVCAAAGIAATSPRDGLRHGTSLHATGAAAQAGGLGGTLGAPHRAPPAPFGALGHDLATSRRGRGRGTRLTTHQEACRTVA